MLETGQLIDQKYKILSQIGKGGMSVVYMAINEKANKTWAIKEVRKDGVLDFESVKQGLIVETEMLKNLKHNNLPSIVDVIDDKDSFLIVMDYIEGNPLNKLIEESGAQPQDMVIKCAKQLCDVLGYLHSRTPAIIYRDMKPANIMLKPDGNVVLIDFGTAREYKEKNIADTTCLGTVGYAAPEQFGGQGQTDARTDIYCLGATLYHLVTGVNPSEPPYEILPICQVNPSLSKGLEKIICKCCERNPNDRYQSCEELMFDLEHYDEIDDVYRGKQKKKLRRIVFFFILSIIFSVVGIALRIVKYNQSSAAYAMKIDEALKSNSYESKMNSYLDAIKISGQNGKKDSYLGLIQTFKENDYVFTVEEQKILVKAISENKESILEDPNGYVEICFELAKLFWYYYDYGNVENNQITKMKSAIEWFDDVQKYATNDYENLVMANVYGSIGKFYRDITINTVEANDKGIYKELFVNMNQLLDFVIEREENSEIVILELLEMIRNSLQQYASKFRGDGITKQEMLDIYQRIEKELELITPTTDKTQSMKKNTSQYMQDTKDVIEIVFSKEGVE
ncbi:MAG: serine/threonine-protein kinase [Clostridiales bacterium]|nr:serine/threonine-protein kinase [Clostridiales bacterium]